MITVQANTISEAISQAEKELNVKGSEMCYEVIQEEKSFPFKKPAIIKACTKDEIESINKVITEPIIKPINNPKPVPKCPTCQSTNVKKISNGKRWITTGLFGIASSDLGKTMECENCGYKW